MTATLSWSILSIIFWAVAAFPYWVGKIFRKCVEKCIVGLNGQAKKECVHPILTYYSMCPCITTTSSSSFCCCLLHCSTICGSDCQKEREGKGSRRQMNKVLQCKMSNLSRVASFGSSLLLYAYIV